MKKIIAVISICCAHVAAAETLSFHAFVTAVEKGHPETSLDVLDDRSARAAVKWVGRLADPALSFEREGMQDKLALTQTFPWPGSLEAEQRAAAAGAEASDVARLSNAAERAYVAKRLFMKMVAFAREIDAQRAAVAEAERMHELSGARYQQGVGSHMDFLTARNNLLVVKANLEALTGEREALEDEAFAMMGRARTAGVSFELNYPPDDAHPLADDHTALAIKAQGAFAAARADAAYRATLPSVTAGAMVMRDDKMAEPRFGGMVGVSLPVFSGAKREVFSEERALAARKAEGRLAWHETQKLQATTRVDRRVARLAANLDTLRRDILPSLLEHDASARAAYAEGRGTIAAVLESRAVLLATRFAEAEAEAAWHLARLARAAVIGGHLDAEADVSMPTLQLPGMGQSMGEMALPRRSAGKRKRRANAGDTAAPEGTTSPEPAESGNSPAMPRGMGM